jgi:hypothetical protein
MLSIQANGMIAGIFGMNLRVIAGNGRGNEH